jgi:hypothetical protein
VFDGVNIAMPCLRVASLLEPAVEAARGDMSWRILNMLEYTRNVGSFLPDGYADWKRNRVYKCCVMFMPSDIEGKRATTTVSRTKCNRLRKTSKGL